LFRAVPDRMFGEPVLAAAATAAAGSPTTLSAAASVVAASVSASASASKHELMLDSWTHVAIRLDNVACSDLFCRVLLYLSAG
jgi:hypothetical protein